MQPIHFHILVLLFFHDCSSPNYLNTSFVLPLVPPLNIPSCAIQNWQSHSPRQRHSLVLKVVWHCLIMMKASKWVHHIHYTWKLGPRLSQDNLRRGSDRVSLPLSPCFSFSPVPHYVCVPLWACGDEPLIGWWLLWQAWQGVTWTATICNCL